MLTVGHIDGNGRPGTLVFYTVGRECGRGEQMSKHPENTIAAWRALSNSRSRTSDESQVIFHAWWTLCGRLPALPFQEEKSKLKITGIRIVETRPKRPVPSYTPAPGSWSTGGVEVANPMSIYPEYKPERSLWNPDPGKLGTFTVEVSTDKGVKGYGSGGAGGAPVIQQHLVKLLIGEDPFNIERIWDIMYRSTLPYGQAGIAINAISGVDLALWDLVGKALGVPVYELLGGATKTRIPAYCTGNDIEQHIKFGYKRLKLAMAYGPADGYIGQKKNVELVKRTRELLGPDGDIMLDCYMAWNEQYTIDMAGLVEPYRVYWMEECLQPRDYAGFGRVRAAIKSTRIVTGEHEYTRFAFRHFLSTIARLFGSPTCIGAEA